MLEAAEERRQILVRGGIGQVSCSMETETGSRHPLYTLRIETSASLLAREKDQAHKVETILVANGLRFDHFRKARAELIAADMELPPCFPKTFAASKLGLKLTSSDIEERRKGIEDFFGRVFGKFLEYTLEQQLTLCDALPFVERHPLPRVAVPPPSSTATPPKQQSDDVIIPSEKTTPILRRRNEQLYRLRSLLLQKDTCEARVGVEVDASSIHPLYTLRLVIENLTFVSLLRRFSFYASAHDLVRSFETKAASPPVHLPDFPERFMLMRIGLKLGAAAIENRRHKLQVYFAGLIGAFSHFADQEQELLLEALDLTQTPTTPSLPPATQNEEIDSNQKPPSSLTTNNNNNKEHTTTQTMTTTFSDDDDEEEDDVDDDEEDDTRIPPSSINGGLAGVFGLLEDPTVEEAPADSSSSTSKQRDQGKEKQKKTQQPITTVYDPVLYARTTQQQLVDLAEGVITQKQGSRVLVFHLCSVDGLDAFETGTELWITASTDSIDSRLTSTITLGEDKCARWQPYYPMLFSLDGDSIDEESGLYVTVHRDDCGSEKQAETHGKDQSIVAHAVLGNLLGDFEGGHNDEDEQNNAASTSDKSKSISFLDLSLDLISDKKESTLKGGVIRALVAIVENKQVLDFARTRAEAIYKYEQMTEDCRPGLTSKTDILPCVCFSDFVPSFFDFHYDDHPSSSPPGQSPKKGVLATSIDWDLMGYALLNDDWVLLPAVNLAGTLPLSDNEAMIQDWTPLSRPFEYARNADSGVWTEKSDPCLTVRRSIYFRLIAIPSTTRPGLNKRNSSGRRMSRRPSRTSALKLPS